MDEEPKYYRVVRHHQISIFEQMVNDLIEQGWNPVGGMAISQHKHDFDYYYQSMTKIED